MSTLSFGDGNKYFGPFFKAEDLGKLVEGDSLIISPDEKIRIYEKGNIEQKIYSLFHKTITIEIGGKEIICDRTSLLENLDLSETATDAEIMKKFARALLSNKDMSAAIRAHSMEAAVKQLALTISDDNSVAGTKEQIELFFEFLQTTRTTASKEELKAFMSSHLAGDTYQFPVDDLKDFVWKHRDPDKSTRQAKFSEVFEIPGSKIVAFIDTVLPPEQPAGTAVQSEATLIDVGDSRQFLLQLIGYGIRATEQEIDNFLKKQGLANNEISPYDLHAFILAHHDSTGKQSLEELPESLGKFFWNSNHPMIKIVCQMIENVPSDLAKIEQDTKRFLESDQGKALTAEVDSVKKLATHIFVHLPEWQKVLESDSSFQGLKITKQLSGLEYGITVDYNPETKTCELLIKIKGKEPTGSYKRVMFPASWLTERGVAFGVPHKERRTERDIEALEQEGKFHEKAKDCENVLQVSFKRFIQWPPSAENRVKESVAMVSEKMNLGTLSDVLKNKAQFTPGQWKQIWLGVAAGVSQLHHLDPPIIHEDIKPGNILLQRLSNGQIIAKLADLGVAREGESGHSEIGTLDFESPEKFLKRSDGNGFSDDVWSLGITYFKLKNGALPSLLQDWEEPSDLRNILLYNADQIRGLEPSDQNSLDHLIWRMLDPDSYTRPDIETIISDIQNLPETAFAT